MIKLIVSKLKRAVSCSIYHLDFSLEWCKNLCFFVTDIPRSGVGEGDNGICGVLHPSQRRMPVVGRTTQTEGKSENSKHL